MKTLIKTIFLLAIIAACSYFIGRVTKGGWKPNAVAQSVLIALHLQAAPCTESIKYSIGSFDTRFGISKAYFVSAIEDAEAIWEKPFKREFFTYVPTGGELKVNLEYDYRQQATNTLGGLGAEVNNNRTSYDMLKAKYTTLKAQVSASTAAYNTAVAVYNARNQTYNESVSYWNARGGAPKAEYEQLQNEKLSLQSQSSQLQSEQASLNAQISELNDTVSVLNQVARSLNLQVESYNTVGSSLGESFTEGVYEDTATSTYINIYEFSDRGKLVRVLAHELGHALGLDHVTDPKAIMYAYNEGTNEVLTAADIAEVNNKCGMK